MLAEFIGTFTLVFAGTGAIVVGAYAEVEIGALGTGVVFGLSVMAVIYAVGHISGAHINPAVTFGFALVRHFPVRDVPLYWGSQLAGATAASGVLRALFGPEGGLGVTVPSGSTMQSLGLELVLGFLLMFVIMAVATDVRAVGQAAAIAIGATVGLEAIFAGPISGASMNPARSFGPALVSMNFSDHWIYWVAPLVGMSAAAACYRLVRDDAGPAPTGPRSQEDM